MSAERVDPALVEKAARALWEREGHKSGPARYGWDQASPQRKRIVRSYAEAVVRAVFDELGLRECPATDVLTGRMDLGYLVDMDGTPSECTDGRYRCPFCEGDTQSPHDPGASDFHCLLLGRTVWGESAPCTREDWQQRAAGESDWRPVGAKS